MMQKAALRKQYLTQRRALPTVEVGQRSQQITDQVIALLEVLPTQHDRPTRIHCFLPIVRQNEIDTWPIIRWLWAQKQRFEVVVPITDFTHGELANVLITPDSQLKTNRFGIPEPENTPDAVFLLPEQLDMVLTPLLVADRQGQRVGYGGGYYDRLLAKCRPDCQRIGLSLFDLIDQIDDVFSGDIPLNACVTPQTNWEF
jgi:5-formyltetrahydrofolate cyclo-ligase